MIPLFDPGHRFSMRSLAGRQKRAGKAEVIALPRLQQVP